MTVVSTMNSCLVAGLLALMCSPTFAGNGGRVGDGGDWRSIILNQAQRESANWTNTAAKNRKFFADDSELPRDSIAFRLVMHPQSLEVLAKDIIDSDHIYRDDSKAPRREYSTCAWTNDPSAANLSDVVFSLDLCEGGLRDGGQSFANRLMIHESVHHLLRSPSLRKAIGANFTGSEEERDRKEDQLCDEVAAAIHRLFERVIHEGKPHWRDIETPHFDFSNGTSKTFEPRGFHVTAWTGQTGRKSTSDRMIVWGGCHEGKHTIYACGDDQYFNDGAIFSPGDNKWFPMSTKNAPSPRASAASVWMDRSAPAKLRNKLIVWGGCVQGDGCDVRLNNGGVYDISSNSWEQIPATAGSPKPRVNHSLVWTGSKLIVWGGHPSNDGDVRLVAPLNDGGIYDPSSKTWTKLASDLPNTPGARGFHTALWTGNTGNPRTANKMLIWGGCVQDIADACSDPLGDGHLFDPSTMQWTKLIATESGPVARHHHSALFVAKQFRLYIFGGFDKRANVISDGAILDLKKGSWQKMTGMSQGRFKHQAVWAGDKMLIFGGKYYNDETKSFPMASKVLAYLPGAGGGNSSGRWIAYTTDELDPLKTIEHSTIWTGFALLAWGGQIFDQGFTNTGSLFFSGIAKP